MSGTNMQPLYFTIITIIIGIIALIVPPELIRGYDEIKHDKIRIKYGMILTRILGSIFLISGIVSLIKFLILK